MKDLKIKLNEGTYNALKELTETMLNIKLTTEEEQKEATDKDISKLISGIINLKEFTKMLKEYERLADQLAKGGELNAK